MRIVHAANFTYVDVLFVQLFRHRVNRLVAALPDCFVHLHLQDEVAPAFKIQPQLDAIGEVLLQLRGRRGKFRHPDNAEDANQNDDGYENKLPPEIGTHAGWLSLLRRFRLQACNSGARYFDFHLFGNAQLDGVIF